MKKVMIIFLMTIGFLSNAFAHEHHPPHQGVLIVLGEEFAHLELVLDSATGTLSAYSLDGEAENAVPLTQSEIAFKVTPVNGAQFDLSLKAVENPLTGETVGNTSEFKGQTDMLRGVTRFAGVITTINTKDQDFKNVSFGFPEGNDHDEK